MCRSSHEKEQVMDASRIIELIQAKEQPTVDDLADAFELVFDELDRTIGHLEKREKAMYDEDPITLSHETHPKVFKSHEWVQIRGEMTAGDTVAIQNKLSVTGRGKDVQVHMNLGDVALATVQRMVLGWNITRTVKRGSKTTEVAIEYSVNNVPNLRKAVFDLINAEINRLNEPESDDEQEDFTSGAAEPTEGSLDQTNLHRVK